MNENIDLTKILKNCPKGTKLHSTIFGDVKFCYIDESDAYPIKLNVEGECDGSVTADGKHYVEYDGNARYFLHEGRGIGISLQLHGTRRRDLILRHYSHLIRYF